MNQNNEEVIYVSLNDIPPTNTRKQFIRYFLRGNSYNTYLDENYEKLQCENNAYRSITDLYKIVKSRFPKTTFETVVKIVKEFMEEDKSVILVYCTTIHKCVVKFKPNKSGEWLSKYSKNNYYEDKGEDGYCLKDYEEMMKNL